MATKVQEKAATAAAKNGFSLISNEKLKQIYATMLKWRTLDEHLRPLLLRSKFPREYCAAVGQEATIIGAAIDLRAGDFIAASHRALTTSLIRNLPLTKCLSQILAQTVNPAVGRSFSAVNSSASSKGVARPVTMAGQLKLAAEVALEKKKQNRGDVVLAFSGEGSASINSWNKALKLAGRHRLPTLFVAQYDFSPANRKRQSMVPNPRPTSESYGFPSIPVDGNDAVAVYRVAFEAITRARQGGGPTLIDCKRYISEGNPIDLMEDYLTRKDLFTEEWKRQTLDGFQMELHEAITLASIVPLAFSVESSTLPTQSAQGTAS